MLIERMRKRLSTATGTLAAAKKIAENKRRGPSFRPPYCLRLGHSLRSGLNDRDVAVDDFARSAGPPDDAGKRAVDLKRPTVELRPALGDIVSHRPT
jgi:hypothetical protein